MSKKLSKAQVAAMERLSFDKWLCAWKLGCSISTLFALKNKGLVERHDREWAITNPRLDIEWRKRRTRPYRIVKRYGPEAAYKERSKT